MMLLSEKYSNNIFMKVSSIDEFYVDDLSIELFVERYFMAKRETRIYQQRTCINTVLRLLSPDMLTVRDLWLFETSLTTGKL